MNEFKKGQHLALKGDGGLMAKNPVAPYTEDSSKIYQ